MANKEYYEGWLSLKHQFSQALAEDERLQQMAIGYIGVKPQGTAVELIGRTYCKYITLYNKLCDIYDQMQQVQRREYLKKIIDAITCRLLELKWIFEDVEVFEYTYHDNALQQLLMIPHDVEILCPFFYPFEIRQQELQYIVDEILSGNRLGDPTPTPSEIERREEERLEEERIIQEEKEAEIKRKLAMGEDILEPEEFIMLTPKELEELKFREEYNSRLFDIQRMERTRKITKDKVQKAIKDANMYLELAGLKKPPARLELQERAAHFIQVVYREYMDLKRQYAKYHQLKTKLGMIFTSWSAPSAKIQLEKVKEVRREFRRNYYKKWIEDNIKEKDRVLRLRKDDMMEDISDHIRAWFREWYDEVRTFDEYPWPDEGGTILVVKGETFTTDEFIEWRAEEDKRIKKEAQAPKSKEDIKAAKIAAREEKKKQAEDARKKELGRIANYKKMRMKPDNDPGVNYNIGTRLTPLQEAWEKYENQWKGIDKPDVSLDVMRGYLMQLVTENVLNDIHLALRPIVDEMMRLELVLLKNALKKDCAEEGVPVIQPKKRKKPRKVKKPKPEKGKPVVMFQRLVDEGIVRKYPHTTLDDYWGERNYAAADLRAVLWTPSFPPPSKGDVKEQVRVRCLLPLGSSCPNAERVQLLVGPRSSGKKTLIYAIATETNSILFDLSPMNVYNKFPGPKYLKQMYNLVNKMSRILAPSIILVDRVDKMFYKKVPKEEKMFDPTRLSSDIYTSLIKQVKGEDKLLVLGTANEPWLAKAAPMSKAFSNVILIPRTDYSSLSFILLKTLMKYHTIDREFDIHSIAQTLRGYNVSGVQKAIERVLNAKRVAELYCMPLQPMEIVNAVLESDDCYYTDLEEASWYWTWYYSYSSWTPKYEYYMSMLESQLAFKMKGKKKK